MKSNIRRSAIIVSTYQNGIYFMLIAKNLKAALKGGKYLATQGRYWQGVTFLSDDDYLKKYEFLNKIPFSHAQFTGGLTVATAVAWSQQVGEGQHNYINRIPLFNEDVNQPIDKSHVEHVVKAYSCLGEIISESGEACSMFVGQNTALLAELIECLPSEFHTQSDIPFSNEWFLELYGLIPDSEQKSEIKTLFKTSGLDLDDLGNNDFYAHYEWVRFQQDLKELSKIIVKMNITPKILKNHAIETPTLLVVVDGSNVYLRAVTAYVVCEAIELIQLSLREREFAKSRFAVEEYYPVCVDLPFLDNLHKWGILAHSSKFSHMGMFISFRDFEKLPKISEAKTLLSTDYKFFNTSFSYGNGGYGFSNTGLDGPLKKVFI
jgi:hypothetical protein